MFRKGEKSLTACLHNLVMWIKNSCNNLTTTICLRQLKWCNKACTYFHHELSDFWLTHPVYPWCLFPASSVLPSAHHQTFGWGSGMACCWALTLQKSNIKMFVIWMSEQFKLLLKWGECLFHLNMKAKYNALVYFYG